MFNKSTGPSANLAQNAEAESEKSERWIQKLWDPSSLEAWGNTPALIREIDGGVRETGVAGAMLADLPADVVGIDYLRTVGRLVMRLNTQSIPLQVTQI